MGPGFIPFPSETADGLPTHKQLTQEFRLESPSTGAFNWQAGVYYFEEDYDIESFSYDRLAGGAQNDYLRSNQTNTAWAVFGSVQLRGDPAFEVRAGVRYTHDEKDFVTGTPEGFTFPDPTRPDHRQPERRQRQLGSVAARTRSRRRSTSTRASRPASAAPASNRPRFGDHSVADPETNLRTKPA